MEEQNFGSPIKVDNVKVEPAHFGAGDDSKTMIIELQHSNGHVLNSRLQSQPINGNPAGEFPCGINLYTVASGGVAFRKYCNPEILNNFFALDNKFNKVKQKSIVLPVFDIKGLLTVSVYLVCFRYIPHIFIYCQFILLRNLVFR